MLFKNMYSVTFALSVILLSYIFVKWKLSFWKRVGLDYLEPQFIFGNVKDFILSKLNIGDQFAVIYQQMKSRGWKHGGVYQMTRPTYIPVDLELVKNILVKDFWYFPNHDFYLNEEDDPLTGHLFALEDNKWKNLRAKLSPTFTSGKLKTMFQTLLACSPNLEDLLNNCAISKEPVDIKDAVSRFTTDIIGSCAFGIECNSLKNPESDFTYYGRKVFKLEGLRKFKNMITIFWPRWILKGMGLRTTPKDVQEFYMNLVKSTIHYRETNNVERKDFIQLLIQLRRKGALTEESLKSSGENGDKYLSINEIAAQSFVFLVAGFETSATTMNFALYELSRNQEIQNRLREEIKTVLNKHDGVVSYESIMEMNYLDQTVQETLRRYPPLGTTTRVCTKNYRVPDSNIVIPRGVKVTIPIQGIHMDPEYYPNPEKFDPDRFSDQGKSTRPAFAFLPFGEGPRICIGARFGLLEVKVGLCIMIKKFKFTLSDKTKTPIRFSTESITTSSDSEIWLNVAEVQ